MLPRSIAPQSGVVIKCGGSAETAIFTIVDKFYGINRMPATNVLGNSEMNSGIKIAS